MRTRCPYNLWNVCFVIFSILYPYDSISSFLRTDRFLGDARLDLQIDNIPRGSEDTVYGNGLFSEVQNRTYIVQGLLID